MINSQGNAGKSSLYFFNSKFYGKEGEGVELKLESTKISIYKSVFSDNNKFLGIKIFESILLLENCIFYSLKSSMHQNIFISNYSLIIIRDIFIRGL